MTTVSTFGTRSVAAKLSASRSAWRAEKPVGAAEHGVLLVQDHRRTLPHQTRGQHRRDAGIAAEADHRRGVDAREDPPRLQHAAAHRQHRLARAQRAAAGDAGAADDEPLEPREHRALQTAGARVGHQRHAPPARQQFARQRLGGKEVAARAAGGDDDGKYRGASHGTSP